MKKIIIIATFATIASSPFFCGESILYGKLKSEIIVKVEFKERTVCGIYIIDLKGKLLGYKSVKELRNRVDNAVKKGFKKLILNLKNLEYLDSTGLSEIVRSYTTIRKAKGKLVLANVQKKVYDLLSVTKLVTVLDIADSMDEAIQMMKKAPTKSATN